MRGRRKEADEHDENYAEKKLKGLHNLQLQILAMGMTGRLTAKRISYATNERWTMDEIRSALDYMEENDVLE